MTQSQTKTAEKKISRVIKWLERCLAACRAGSFDGAFMDVECARAEFDAARDEIWCATAEAHGKPRVAHGALVRVAFAVLIVVLLTASPLSNANFIEWVTPDEKALLTALRSRLSEENAGTVVDVADISVAAVAPVVVRQQKIAYSPPPKVQQRANKGGVRSVQKSSSTIYGNNKSASEVQILSLVNTAERALRSGSESAVKVER